MTYLKPLPYYEDLYDKLTVEAARRNLTYFQQMYDKWFEIMPEDKPGDFRPTFHLNWIYMGFVGNELLDRYDKRNSTISEWMARDQAQDNRLASARLTTEPVCHHCGKTGLRITSKLFMNRDGMDSPEEVLFMMQCPSCQKNSACWQDGSAWEIKPTECPKCRTNMDKQDSVAKKIHTTVYTCPSCSHSYKEKYDYSSKEEKLDPEFEKDRQIFCLLDEKMLEEHRDARRRHEGLVELTKELQEKEENKHIYDAMAELKKPKIAELKELLAPAVEKAGYIEFSLDKPEMGRDVFVGFNCLDSKPDREDYDSRQVLKRLINRTLEKTNWRLMSEGISHRLGYLSGRLHAYESEEDLKKLVAQNKKLKAVKPRKLGADQVDLKDVKNADGEEIHL